MRDKLLTLTDLLVKKKDTEGLTLLREVTLELFYSGFEVENLSLIELNDYIDGAKSAIEKDKDPEEIITLPIRKLMDTY